MFKNVIFDWSGVVKDCFEAHVWSVGKMMEIFGGSAISREELKENWEQPYMNFWNKYFPELTLEEKQKVYYEVLLRKDCPKSPAYAGIVDLIKEIKKRGAFLAIISSDSPKTLLPEIKEYGLENIFSEVITDVHDKADGLNKIMVQNGHKKDETVFIGDSNHEVEVGKEAGIKTIAVTWGFSTEDKLKSKNPDYLVHNIKELEEVLLK